MKEGGKQGGRDGGGGGQAGSGISSYLRFHLIISLEQYLFPSEVIHILHFWSFFTVCRLKPLSIG